MKLKNSTDWPDRFLRRMVAWCCRELGHPVSRIREAQFRNRTRAAYSGHAYYSFRRFVASVGPASCFPLKSDGRPGMDGEVIADRVEALIAITAHEIAHLAQHRDGRLNRLAARGATERDARWHEVMALRSFRVNREALLAEWNEPSAEPVKEKATIQERRAVRAAEALAEWQRKAKLAATKIKKYRRQVRYYEKAIAAKRSM